VKPALVVGDTVVLVYAPDICSPSMVHLDGKIAVVESFDEEWVHVRIGSSTGSWPRRYALLEHAMSRRIAELESRVQERERKINQLRDERKGATQRVGHLETRVQELECKVTVLTCDLAEEKARHTALSTGTTAEDN